jgi:hypothetical protein
VKESGREYVAAHGPYALRKVAKVHFRTAADVAPGHYTAAPKVPWVRRGGARVARLSGRGDVLVEGAALALPPSQFGRIAPRDWRFAIWSLPRVSEEKSTMGFDL